jgi:hypothetical protein
MKPERIGLVLVSGSIFASPFVIWMMDNENYEILGFTLIISGFVAVTAIGVLIFHILKKKGL